MPSDKVASPDKPGSHDSRLQHVVVVGGGIAGLAAAVRLRDRLPDARITLLEQSPRLGGKLLTGSLTWDDREVTVELGADALLARVTMALEFARRLGLGEALRHPLTGSAYLWVDRALRRFPASTVMGIPAAPEDLAEAGLISPAALAAMEREPEVSGPLLTSDISVGELVRQRLGSELVTNVVDPLLGGVYAGSADDLSLRAAIPAIAGQLEQHPSLVAAARAVRGRATSGPVFAGVFGGMGRLVDAARAELVGAGVTVRTSAAVRQLRKVSDGWQLTVGADAEIVFADGLVIGTPARPAARLLAELTPTASDLLDDIEYASVALITLAFPVAAGEELFPPGSGVLVPESSGLSIKAATFSSQKWGSEASDVSVVRISLGRFGQDTWLHRNDEELVAVARADLETLVGELPPPVASAVQRWGGALPQYAVGHLDRVSRIRAELAALDSPIQLAGAGYDGVGVAACIGSGNRAADEIAANLPVAVQVENSAF